MSRPVFLCIVFSVIFFVSFCKSASDLRGSDGQFKEGYQVDGTFIVMARGSSGVRSEGKSKRKAEARSHAVTAAEQRFIQLVTEDANRTSQTQKYSSDEELLNRLSDLFKKKNRVLEEVYDSREACELVIQIDESDLKSYIRK